jgi:phosphopantothenoylcysteine decarboxylase/phosphopantothenate--cysteine ligase
MRCLVTAGPTYEPLDKVRRLTNFSSGRLGTELARFLTEHGHETTLLLGEQATHWSKPDKTKVERFGTTTDLLKRLERHGSSPTAPQAIFHAAAVSDFAFGKIFSQSGSGALTEVYGGKITTRDGRLLAELVPTPKILRQLRRLFSQAVIVGWKYEVDGNRAGAVGLGETQIRECHTNACVVNGPAYGLGFGLLLNTGAIQHLRGPEDLYEALEKLIRATARP